MAGNRIEPPAGMGPFGMSEEQAKQKEEADRKAQQEAWEKRKYVSDYYNHFVLRRADDDAPLFVPLTTKEKDAHANDPDMSGQGTISAGPDASAFPKYDYYKVKVGKDENGESIFSKEFDILYDKKGVRPASDKLFHGEFDKDGWSAALDFAVSELRYQSIRISVADQPNNPKDARRHIQAMIELCAEKKIPVDVAALKNLPFLQQLSAKDRHALIQAAQATESYRDHMMMMTGVSDKNSLLNFEEKLKQTSKLENIGDDAAKQKRYADKILSDKQNNNVAFTDADIDKKLAAVKNQLDKMGNRITNVNDIHARLDEGVTAEKKLINDPDAQIKAEKLVNPVVSAKKSWFSTANQAFKKSIQDPTDNDRREFLNAIKKESSNSAEQREKTYKAMEDEIKDLKLRNETCKEIVEKVKTQPGNKTADQTQKITAMEKQIADRTTELKEKMDVLQEMRKWDNADRSALLKNKQEQIDAKQARQQHP